MNHLCFTAGLHSWSNILHQTKSLNTPITLKSFTQCAADTSKDVQCTCCTAVRYWNLIHVKYHNVATMAPFSFICDLYMSHNSTQRTHWSRFSTTLLMWLQMLFKCCQRHLGAKRHKIQACSFVVFFHCFAAMSSKALAKSTVCSSDAQFQKRSHK